MQATSKVQEDAASRAVRAHARAWLYLCAHLAAHCVEEAVYGFVDVWNPFLATVRARSGLPLPHFTFDGWLTAVVIGVVALTTMTPLVARGVRGVRVASYMFAGVMIANGLNHLISPLYLGRFLPGQFTAPLLILASLWLILAARRVGHPATPAGPILGSFLFFLAAPGTVAGWIPYTITGWRTESPVGGFVPIRAVGMTLIVVASVALIECFARFAIVGRGVPAPVAPTRTLVVSGLYRHCRNPMYVAVVSAIFGQALVFGSTSLLLYGSVVWLAFHLFVLGYEEPTLGRQFTNYNDYRQHVPRWLPRLRPWSGA